MTSTVTITNNWQLHVPLAMREIVGLKKPGVVTVSAKKGALVIKPKKSRILSLAGSLHHLYKKKPIDIDNLRDIIDYSEA